MDSIFTDQEIEDLKDRRQEILRYNRKKDLYGRMYGGSESRFPLTQAIEDDGTPTEIKPMFDNGHVTHDFDEAYRDILEKFQKEWAEEIDKIREKIWYGNNNIKEEDNMSDKVTHGDECISVYGDREQIEHLVSIWEDNGFNPMKNYDMWLSDEGNYIHLEPWDKFKVHNHNDGVLERYQYDANIESDWVHVTSLVPKSETKVTAEEIDGASKYFPETEANNHNNKLLLL